MCPAGKLLDDVIIAKDWKVFWLQIGTTAGTILEIKILIACRGIMDVFVTFSASFHHWFTVDSTILVQENYFAAINTVDATTISVETFPSLTDDHKVSIRIESHLSLFLWGR